MADDVRWLDQTEMTAWRAFLKVSTRLFDQLDRELVESHGLSLGDYEVLAILSDAPDRRLRMSELASRLMVSRSRLTHHADRLERQGLLARASCPTDRRGAFAVLTDAGAAKLAEAAPCHLDGVRQHFVDLLTADQVATLARALSKVADHLEVDLSTPVTALPASTTDAAVASGHG
jgi:DNA-binding MarR family transcriptional regulator